MLTLLMDSPLQTKELWSLCIEAYNVKTLRVSIIGSLFLLSIECLFIPFYKQYIGRQSDYKSGTGFIGNLKHIQQASKVIDLKIDFHVIILF